MKVTMSTLLEVSGLSKSFGSQRILDGIDFTVERGTCVSFIGENGAGKSTLGKCLVGVHSPDAGRISFDGRMIRPASPRAAMQLGIGLLPQELAYVPEMTAFENIVLGNWPSRAGVTTPRAQRRAVAAKLDDFGIDLDVELRMRDLSLADRQLVEIAKVLMRDAKLLVLDEPTAALNSRESNDLIELLGRLKAEGLSAIYISHRMDEVGRFSDVINVLRNGSIVLTATPGSTDDRELITAMLGQAPGTLTETDAATDGAVVCEVVDLSSGGTPSLTDVSFSVRKGEILGLFGVRGSGQDVVAEVLGGMRPDVRGSITVGGLPRRAFANPRESQAARVSYVPAERKRNGLVLGMSVRENIVLPVARLVSRVLGIIDQRAERELSARYAKTFDLRFASFSQAVAELSGGNQQKVLLASRLAQRPEVLVLHEPTRGVDIGARLQIHEHLRALAAEGIACLLVTSDVEEAVAVSDRIVVMRDGRVVAELDADQRTQESTIFHATGAQR
ncbi:sugar ABC transporter ATP-binding protein [soil metagenome]